MSFQPGKAAQLTLDSAAGTPVDLSAFFDKITGPQMQITMLVVTTFGATAKRVIPGLKDGGQLQLSGPADTGTGTSHFATLWSNGGQLSAGGSLSFVFGPAGTTATFPKQTG